jgi:hypothetical protein
LAAAVAVPIFTNVALCKVPTGLVSIRAAPTTRSAHATRAMTQLLLPHREEEAAIWENQMCDHFTTKCHATTVVSRRFAPDITA